MGKTEITAGRWKVKRIDPMNWQVFELREIKHEGRGKGAGANRKGEVDWMACPAYFGKLENALEWCFDREVSGSAMKRELKDAVAEIRRIKDSFAREVGKAVEACGNAESAKNN